MTQHDVTVTVTVLILVVTATVMSRLSPYEAFSKLNGMATTSCDEHVTVLCTSLHAVL
jgi:hypothetical protein